MGFARVNKAVSGCVVFELTVDIVRRLLDYNPETGEFYWRERTPDLIWTDKERDREWECNRWNSQWAGKRAGCVNKRDGYRYIKIYAKRYSEHRLAYFIMEGAWPHDEIDHKDGDVGNSKWENLRPATRLQNGYNLKLYTSSTTGFKGVSLHKLSGKYQTYITVNRKRVYLGLFDTPEEAHVKVCEARLKYHGEFARVA